MYGEVLGVAKQVTDLEHRALYTHCYGHALNLAAQNSIKRIKLMQDTLDTTLEITKLIKNPLNVKLFSKSLPMILRQDLLVFALYVLQDGVRAEALTSISENYQALQSTWEAARQATKDSEMRARIVGVASQMESFDYFFGVELGRK